MADLPPFIEFLEANRRPVHRFLTVAVGPGEADDVFQETFLAALRAFPRLGHANHLDRWVLKIASRKAIDHHRAARRRAAPTGASPDEAAIEEAGGDDALWLAVRALPDKQRIAVVHRHVLDRPYAEIAELMDTSEQAVRANVSQGLKRLRELVT